MGGFKLLLLSAPALIGHADALGTRSATSAESALNPIRKVVTLLQEMQKKVSEEGEKEKDLYDKFECYCKHSGGDLKASIEAANVKGPSVTADIESHEEKLELSKEQLSTAQGDRESAVNAMAEATALREKEAAEYAKKSADLDANVGAIHKAVAALEKGAYAGFLQTPSAGRLRRLVSAGKMSAVANEEDRQAVIAFLDSQQSTGYAPQSGQIIGILKEMGDEMAGDLADEVAAEKAAIVSYEELMAAKKKEKGALTDTIEAKSMKIGELGVSVAQLKNDLEDSGEALAADTKFLEELEKGCKTKADEWAERQKTRAEELLALSDTIKVLNDDDALDLFKGTLASGSSFMQVSVTSQALRSRALAEIRRAQKKSKSPSLDFIALALRGKKKGFEEVIGMVDKMSATLKKEQVTDDNKKEYCGAQLDTSDDKRKELERLVSDKEAAIADAKESIAAATEDSKTLTAGIKALDKSVAEATEDRKSENKAYKELMAQNTAAKELIHFAKNRLNKFYNKALYKPPPKRELSKEDRIAVNMGGTPPPTEAPGGIAGTGISVGGSFVQVSAHRQREAPPPPPETFGAYTKKSEETGGVMSMMDLLVKDLDKEMTEASQEEKDSQADYEQMMADSAEKRAADSKSLAGKEATKADMSGQLETHTSEHSAASKEHMATMEYIQSIHGECDWLLKYHGARKEARDGEIESLGNAKSVLSGADFSLLQKDRRLRR